MVNFHKLQLNCTSFEIEMPFKIQGLITETTGMAKCLNAEGETAAKIVGIFITPKYQQSMVNHATGASSEISLDS